MKPSFVVLTNAAPADEPLLGYAAALAAAVGATLHLVHVVSMPPIATLEYSLPLLDTSYVPAVRDGLRRAAARLPVPTTVEVLESDWHGALVQVTAAYQPALLLAGLTATDGPFDELLSNRALPLAHDTGYPLLLVPQYLPVAALRPPRCLALAVRDQAFILTPEALALSPLLAALDAAVVPTTVGRADEPNAGRHGLAAAQECGLTPALAGSSLYRVVAEAPASGLQRAVEELSADILVLLDPGHGWVSKLFGESVIDEVLRQTPVPVLLLPTQ